MTSISLHPAPSFRTVVREQVRAQGLMMRMAGALFAAVMLLIAAACLRMAFVMKGAGQGTGSMTNFTFSPQMSVIVSGLALLLPIMIWQDEDPARRVYHRAMPVAQPMHAFMKVLAGWLWLMAVIALFLTGMVIIPLLASRIAGGGQPYHPGFAWWEWLIPVTSATIAYVIASAAAVATRRPLIWIFGLPLLYGAAIDLLLRYGLLRVVRVMRKIATGYFGATAAMSGQTEHADSFASLDRWLGSSVLWGVAAAALLYLVAKRRVDVS